MKQLSYEEAKEVLATMLSPHLWFEKHAHIVPRGGGRPVRAMRANAVQRKMFAAYEEKARKKEPCKMIVLKPRKAGASTGAQAICYHHNRRHAGIRGAIMGDIERTSITMMRMYRTFLESDTFDWEQGRIDPALLKAQSITLPNGSVYGMETAGSANAGRGDTVQVANATEVAHFPKTDTLDPALGFLNSWSDQYAQSLAIFDSTPNGPTGLFYDLWTKKDNGWIKIFLPWFEEEEYQTKFQSNEEREEFGAKLEDHERDEIVRYAVTLEQLKWRRNIIESKCQGDPDKFKQEYPSNDIECLDAETRVGTSGGYVRICDVEVGTMSDHGRIVAKEKKGIRPVFRVTTENGYTVKATAEHLFAVGDTWVPTCELLGKAITIQPPVVAQFEHTVKWTGFAGVEHALLITEKWGAFLGYFAGDGCFGGDTLSMTCDGRDTDLIEDVAQLVEMVSGQRPHPRKVGSNNGGTDLRISNKRFREVFEALGVLKEEDYATKRKVCVPECIWRSPTPVIRQFLRYLFEADGWASKNSCVVKFFSKDLPFIEDVQRLLLVFGIRSTLRHVIKDLRGKKFPGVEMVLRTVDSRKFMDQIGFASARKRAGFAATFTHTAGILGRYNYNDTVVSVEPAGEAEVWDLQIDGKPMFSAGGMLVHNCFLRSSNLRFRSVVIDQVVKACRPPALRGELTMFDNQQVAFQPDMENGSVRIWEEPKVGLRYLVSMDTCTGEDQQESGPDADPDYHSIGVIRPGYVDPNGQRFAPKLVAHHYSRLDTDLAALIAACMSIYYGKCMVIPEVNNCGLTVVKRLEEWGIPVYQRISANHAAGTRDKFSGWRTDGVTRKSIIDDLSANLREWKPEAPTIEIPCEWVAKQLAKFIVTSAGRAQAMPGEHDDGVMMLAIGTYRYNLAYASVMKERKVKRLSIEKINRMQGWKAA